MARKRSEEFDPGHDELQLFEAMLNDKFVNRGLDKILKEVQIMRVLDPENFGEYPGVRLHGGSWRGAKFAYEPDEEGVFVDSIGKVIVCQIYCMENQEVTYNDVRYVGSIRILTLIRDIIHRIVTENPDYPERASDEVKAEFTDVQFDYIEPELEVWVPNYLGQLDASALNIGYLVQYEKQRL